MKALLRFFSRQKQQPPVEAEETAKNLFIGQPAITSQLIPLIRQAVENDTPMEHLLLIGPYGMGRKALARWLAEQTNQKLHILNGADIFGITDLVLFLAEIEEGNLVVLEDIEKVPLPAALSLAHILTDFSFDFPNLKNGRLEKWQTPRFTMLGLTNFKSSLPSRLVARFARELIFEPYSEAEKEDIILSWGRIERNAAACLARQTGGRLSLAREVYLSFFETKLDFEPQISVAKITELTDMLELDEHHLTHTERDLLDILIEADQPLDEKELTSKINISTCTPEKRSRYLESRGLLVKRPEGWQASLRARLWREQPKPFDNEALMLLNSESVRSVTAGLLTKPEQAAPYLIALLGDADPTIRTAVYGALASMGDTISQELGEVLLKKNSPLLVKKAVLQLLSKSSSPKTLSVLQKFITKGDPALKQPAIKGIGFSGQKKAIPFLVRLIKKEKEPIQLAAVGALQQLNCLEIIAPLKEIINEVGFATQKSILTVLGQVGDVHVAGLLDKEKELRLNGQRKTT